MGYTHYWRHKMDFTPVQFKRIGEFAAAAIVNSKIPVGDWSGEKKDAWSITPEEISFNGMGADSHETFRITRLRRLPRKYELDDDERVPVLLEQGMFDFCKTARKPYDDIVVAILLFIEQEYPENLEWSSDGLIHEQMVQGGHCGPLPPDVPGVDAEKGFNLMGNVLDALQEARGWS